MEEQKIGFELAKLAKTKGFDIDFKKDTEYYSSLTGLKHTSSSKRDLKMPHVVKICTQSLLQEWLRKTHNIEVYIRPFYNMDKNYEKHYAYYISYPVGSIRREIYKHSGDLYSGVLNDALIEGLKLVK